MTFCVSPLDLKIQRFNVGHDFSNHPSAFTEHPKGLQAIRILTDPRAHRNLTAVSLHNKFPQHKIIINNPFCFASNLQPASLHKYIYILALCYMFAICAMPTNNYTNIDRRTLQRCPSFSLCNFLLYE